MSVNKVAQKIREDGFKSLASSIYYRIKIYMTVHAYNNTIRDFLPRRGEYRTINPETHPTLKGVNIVMAGKYEKRLLDDIVPWRTPFDDKRWGSFDTHETELISSLQSNIERGDTVVIVGGGYGGTTVVAANNTGQDGEVIAYEASKERTDSIESTLNANSVNDIAKIKNEVVGEPVHVPGSTSDLSLAEPDELPPCDVLELDCEGAEEYILKNMAIQPETIIVETHGCYGAPEENIKSILSNNGYYIDDREVLDSRRGIVILTAKIET